MKNLTRHTTLVLLPLLLAAPACTRREHPGADPAPAARGGKTIRAAPVPPPPDQPKPPELKAVATCTLPGDSAEPLNTEGNVVYGAAGQKLDIAWPKGKGPFPLIVLIHGGGWFSGDKEELGRETEVLAGVGYAVASINYRLSNARAHRFPACVEDARCAVRWLRSQARRYAIDPKKVVAVGFSAGGQIAAMLALGEKVDGLDGAACSAASQPAGVSGAVAFYAPSDLRSSSLLGSGEKESLPRLFGKEPEEAPALAALASPITHVHPGAPPLLLVHGTADTTVPVMHSRKLRAALERARVPSLLVEVAGAGHDFPLISARAEHLRHSCTTLAFFETILKSK